MKYQLSFILVCIFSLITISLTSQVAFLSDEGIAAYRQKTGDFAAKITAFAEKTISDNKGKSENVKTAAYNAYKSNVQREVTPFISDFQESMAKKAEAEKVISKSKNKAEVQKARESLDYHTQRISVIESLDETLRNLESKVVLELTFQDRR
jgi:hypothetical protein